MRPTGWGNASAGEVSKNRRLFRPVVRRWYLRSARGSAGGPCSFTTTTMSSRRTAGTVGHAALRATLRDGKLFARGVSDDKGHITSRLFAIDALLDAQGELPCTVKFIIEGEEETSSVHLKEFVLRTASFWQRTPASGSSAASTTVRRPFSTWACEASAMWNYRWRPPAKMCTPV